MKRLAAVGRILIFMLLLQTVLVISVATADSLIPDPSGFVHRMNTAAVMLLLTAAVAVCAGLKGSLPGIFPVRFGKGYIIYTSVAVLLLLTAPSNYTGGIKPWLLLVYGCIITPVYEELVFRGVIWDRLGTVTKNSLQTAAADTLLFAIWHLGYMIPQLLSGNLTAVAWKLTAGLCYGAVLGFVRMKTGNCYAAIIAHGLLNLFMV